MPTGVYKRKPFTKTHLKNMSKANTKQFFCDIKGCNEKHYGKGLCYKHYFRQRYQDDKEELLKGAKQRYQYQRKERAEWGIQYRKDNKEYISKWKKKWHQTPIGKASSKAARHNRRTLTKDLTIATIQQVYEDNIKKFGTLTCCLCFKWITFGEDSLEHLTPLSRGGSNDFSNLGVAHRKCNNQKYTMTLKEWEKLNKEKRKC